MSSTYPVVFLFCFRHVHHMLAVSVHFPFFDFPSNVNLNVESNIQTAPEYKVYISPLIHFFVRYARVCSLYSDFLQRHHLLMLS